MKVILKIKETTTYEIDVPEVVDGKKRSESEMRSEVEEAIEHCGVEPFLGNRLSNDMTLFLDDEEIL